MDQSYDIGVDKVYTKYVCGKILVCVSNWGTYGKEMIDAWDNVIRFFTLRVGFLCGFLFTAFTPGPAKGNTATDTASIGPLCRSPNMWCHFQVTSG